MPDAFERYVGPADLHDGTIIGLDDQRPALVVVRVRGASGREHVIHFQDVRTVTAIEPIGMMIYALAEMRETGGGRRFVFANWDEEGKERLEIEAREVTFSRDRPGAA